MINVVINHVVMFYNIIEHNNMANMNHPATIVLTRRVI